VQSILKYLFPVPKTDSKRVITFANREDYISFRHHVYKKSGAKDVELKEVGPRFEMKCMSLVCTVPSIIMYVLTTMPHL
jgi:U3 small nucleolar ribonucleoprotein protein IMP4